MVYLAVLAVILVACILTFGLVTFLRGGEFNRKYANKIMQLRILFQAIAVVLILIVVTCSGGS